MGQKDFGILRHTHIYRCLRRAIFLSCSGKPFCHKQPASIDIYTDSLDMFTSSPPQTDGNEHHHQVSLGISFSFFLFLSWE